MKKNIYQTGIKENKVELNEDEIELNEDTIEFLGGQIRFQDLSQFDEHFKWNKFLSYQTFITDNEKSENSQIKDIFLFTEVDNINFWIRAIVKNNDNTNGNTRPNVNININFKSIPTDNKKINANLLKVIQFIPYGILYLNYCEVYLAIFNSNHFIRADNFYFFNFFRLIIDKKPNFFNQIIKQQLENQDSVKIFQETYDKFSQLKNIFEQKAKETKIISTESSKYIKLFEEFFDYYLFKNSKNNNESEDHESEEFENNKQKLNERKDSFQKFSNNQSNLNPITLCEINNKFSPILIYVILLMNIIILFYNLYNLYIILIKNKNN